MYIHVRVGFGVWTYVFSLNTRMRVDTNLELKPWLTGCTIETPTHLTIGQLAPGLVVGVRKIGD